VGASAGCNLVALLATTGGVAELEGAGHGGPQFEMAENLERVVSFLNKYLK
jgi:hypothetical protein